MLDDVTARQYVRATKNGAKYSTTLIRITCSSTAICPKRGAMTLFPVTIHQTWHLSGNPRMECRNKRRYKWEAINQDLAPSQTFRNPVPNELRPDSTSRDPPELIAPVCDCLWHPRRLPGLPMPNKFTLVSTSRESPEYIAPVCDCLWHHHRLPGSLVPNKLRPDLISRESPEFIAPVCDCFWHPRRLPGFPMPNEFTLLSTSRESPEYIAPVCYCLWHPRRLPGSPVPNDLRLANQRITKRAYKVPTTLLSCQYQCLRRNLSKYSTQFNRYGHFHLFRIWHSAKPRLMINVILQFIGLELFNIKLSAKFYQNIPNDLRVKFHFF